ncbi:phospholipase D-like domain-containing protein [Telluria sp. B2]
MPLDKYTAQLTANTMTSVTRQYFDMEQPFAFPRVGNECHAYLNGRDYLAAVATAIRQAKSFVLIADWQCDVDVELDQRGAPGHPGRLSELVYQATQRGVHVKFMLYDSVEKVLDTHDDTSQSILRAIPKGNNQGSVEVLLANPNTGRPHVLSLTSFNIFFSHHQKFIVVDGAIAFLGGLDIAYGRWDTNAFDVVIDPTTRVINDAYNMQIAPARAMTKEEIALTKPESFPKSPRGCSPFLTSFAQDEKVFDERFQPRQPWQDIALHIKGPAVYDVFVNFVLRWNSFAGSGTNRFDNKMAANWFERAKGKDYLVNPLAPGSGSATVQICRSASSEQLSDELKLWGNDYQYINDDWKQPDSARRKIVQEARKAWVSMHQTSIKDAMINCIQSAQAMIYIENQFFISNCGSDAYGSKTPADNTILSEIANAVARAVYAGRGFHVYIVLPVQPEGMLEDAGVVSQAWWALQGIKRGSNSLVNRINAAILKKNMRAWGVMELPATNSGIHDILVKHGMSDEWRKYLTVLNLRNYGRTSTTVMTEMIYVHSKLLIVDDAVAVIGSANINDRSLNGDGDTEIAAVVVDNANANMTDMGQGVKVVTRKFARELRMNLWKKHLGMLVDEATTGVQKEGQVPNGIQIDKPLSTESVGGILALARKNAITYQNVFLQVPSNSHRTMAAGRSLAFPILDAREGTHDFSKPAALAPAFMNGGRPKIEDAHRELRANIRGFFVEIPLDWGAEQGETPQPPAGRTEAIANRQHKKTEHTELPA